MSSAPVVWVGQAGQPVGVVILVGGYGAVGQGLRDEASQVIAITHRTGEQIADIGHLTVAGLKF
jgi:hypothetical protein